MTRRCPGLVAAPTGAATSSVSSSPAPRRVLRETPPLAVAPLLVSDRNCFPLTGLTDRQLRELLAKHPEIPRHVEGHRVLVAAADLVAFVRTVATVDLHAEPAPDAHEGDQLDDADSVLAAIGHRRIGGSAR